MVIVKQMNCQSGQAIAEMCIAMVAIMAVFLGLIFVGGLGISNIQTLLRAKSNVDNYSRSSNPAGYGGDNIYAWDYGSEQRNGDGLAFTVDDQAISNSNAVVDGVPLANEGRTLIMAQFENQEYSESVVTAKHIYTPVSDLGDYVQGNYTRNLPEMFLESANLTSSTGAPDTQIFTINSRQFSAQEINKMKDSFAKLFGVKPDNIDLQNMRSNTVYMPVQNQTATTP
jgi:hypothetical protein